MIKNKKGVTEQTQQVLLVHALQILTSVLQSSSDKSVQRHFPRCIVVRALSLACNVTIVRTAMIKFLRALSDVSVVASQDFVDVSLKTLLTCAGFADVDNQSGSVSTNTNSDLASMLTNVILELSIDTKLVKLLSSAQVADALLLGAVQFKSQRRVLVPMLHAIGNMMRSDSAVGSVMFEKDGGYFLHAVLEHNKEDAITIGACLLCLDCVRPSMFCNSSTPLQPMVRSLLATARVQARDPYMTQATLRTACASMFLMT